MAESIRKVLITPVRVFNRRVLSVFVKFCGASVGSQIVVPRCQYYITTTPSFNVIVILRQFAVLSRKGGSLRDC